MNIRINIGQVFNVAVVDDSPTETPNSARIYSLRNGAEAVFIDEIGNGQNLIIGPFINIVDFRIDIVGNVTVENVATNFGAPVLLSDYVGGGGGIPDPVTTDINMGEGTSININDNATSDRYGSINGDGISLTEVSTDADCTISLESKEFRIRGFALLFADLPTVDPVEENKLWNDAGVLKISSGV